MAEPKKYGTNEIVEVVREGKTISVPEGMDLMEAAKWLRMRHAEEEQEVSLQRTFPCFASEGAIALSKALTNRYGWTSQKGMPGGMFAPPVKPQLIDIEVGLNVVISVPWGRFEIPGMNGYVQTSIDTLDGQPVFGLYCETKKKHQKEVEGLFDETARWARNESIYRGKAVRMHFKEHVDSVTDTFPSFLDVGEAPDMVFPKVIEELVTDNLLAPIQHSEAFRKAEIPLKMGVLLEGPYGCGKTLLANATAHECESHGWTYILIDDAENLAKAVSVARRYQPCVVFCEDIDRAMSGSRSTAMDEILNTIDGIEAKNTEIMVVLTTNHAEKINKAMLRPGRLDVVIPVTPPDAEAVERMVRLYAKGLLKPDSDLTDVGKLLDGCTPAVIREVVERTKRTSIAVYGEAKLMDGDLLSRAAEGMKKHLEMAAPVAEVEPSDAEKAASIYAKGLRNQNVAAH